MATINQLSAASSVSAGDLLPIYSSNNGDARKLSISALLTYFQQQFAAPTMAVNLYVPNTGFSISIPSPVAQDQWIILQPAGALASGTLTLPLNTSTADGTEVLITTTQTISALTVNANGASNVFGSPTALAGGAGVRLRFYASTNSWYAITSPYAALVQQFLLAPTSANLRAVVTDETGTGVLMFNGSPTITTPSVTGGTFSSPTITTPTVTGGTYSSPVLTTPDIGAATGTSLSTTGSQLISGTTGKQGYATGSGGTVTQGAGSGKATAVTLSRTNGSITMDGANLGASTTVSFTLTNTTIEAGDVLILNHISGGTAGAYTLNAQTAAGSATINVRNVSLGALAEAIVIRFAVIKAVSA